MVANYENDFSTEYINKPLISPFNRKKTLSSLIKFKKNREKKNMANVRSLNESNCRLGNILTWIKCSFIATIVWKVMSFHFSRRKNMKY